MKISLSIAKENDSIKSLPIRTIVSTKALENLLKIIGNHSKTCDKNDYSVDGSNQKLLHIFCKCGHELKVRKDSEESHQLSIPESIAAGALCAGIGYSSIKTVFASLEIPFIAKNTYRNAEEKVGENLEATARRTFAINGQLERKLAVEDGNVVKIGGIDYPFINVTVDAGWAKRSYGHSYSSNAGVAVIIGSRTKKILWMDHRIRCCAVCDKKRSNEEQDFNCLDDENGDQNHEPDHVCFKNWTGSAQSMEADIIVDGFNRSLNDHGLIYRYLVGDADSSVYARIQAQVLYPGRIYVEKIDCINHAVRGLNSAIYSIIMTTAYPKKDRDIIEKQINRFGKDVKAAVAYNHENQSRDDDPTSSVTLADDIVNVPAHVLGNHFACKTYFCKSPGILSDDFDGFKRTAAGQALLNAFHRLANRSQRLIYNTTSNFAECFMTVMTKCISGKRINYAQRGSYARRAKSAVMAFDGGAFWLPIIYADSTKPIPEIWVKCAEFFIKAKHRGPTKQGRYKGFKSKTVQSTPTDPDSYGLDAYQGQLSETELLSAVNRLVQSVQVKSVEERDKLEHDTRGQSFNPTWKQERRNRLTASNAGKVFSLRDSTNNTSTLKSILYPTDLSKNENVKNGINQEPEAKRLYSLLNGIDVIECGLFVCIKNGALAASPDGVIEDTGIIEIKCINCPPNQVPSRGDNFLIYKDKKDPNSELMLRRNHKYYMQIISQIYIAQKEFCDFFVYHKPKNDEENILYYQERIQRNKDTDELWDKMEKKLVKFYIEEMAPEIADPIYQRNNVFRVPAFRIKAMEEVKAKKVLKQQTIVVAGSSSE